MRKYGHGGNTGELAKAAGLPAHELLDFSANINPLGPPEWLDSLIASELKALVHYPDPQASALVEAFADHHGISADEVLAGNGSSELLYLIPRLMPRPRAVIPVPCYVDYKKVSELVDIKPDPLYLQEADAFKLDLSALEARLDGNELVFLGQPNNPTGGTFKAEALRSLAGRYSSSLFIVDEAFADFIEGMDRLLHNRPANVIVLCSLTKFYAIPGLRLGCVVADSALIDHLREHTPPWTVNGLAQAVGERALRDQEYAARTRQLVQRLRTRLWDELRSIDGLTVFPGEANFLLVRLDRPDLDAPTLAGRMLSQGIAIRVCTNYDGLDARFFRVAVRRHDENTRLCASLRIVLNGSRKVTLNHPTYAEPRKDAMSPEDLLRPPGVESGSTPLVHRLYAAPMSGEAIERESFRLIDAEAPSHDFTPEEWQVVRRMIHTIADFTIMKDIRFSPDAIASAVQALRDGRPIYVDSNMIRSGISLARLRSVCPDYGPEHLACYVADAEIIDEARRSGLPRSLHAVRKARPMLDGAIVLFGNAPVALLELNRLIVEEKLRPSLVVAMPVGFVHVIESKQELMTLGVPFIALNGRRGGSPLAVSVLHALCSIAATSTQEPSLSPHAPV